MISTLHANVRDTQRFSGIDELRKRRRGSPFYWQPGIDSVGFPNTVDAILCDGNTVHLLQSVFKNYRTFRSELDHSAIQDLVHAELQALPWRFVLVGRDAEVLKDSGLNGHLNALNMPVGKLVIGLPNVNSHWVCFSFLSLRTIFSHNVLSILSDR